MCGRYNVIPNAQGFVYAFGIVAGIETLPDKPRYNIAPTGEPVPVVRQESEGRELCQLRWPLLPHWAKEGRIKFATANAKGETVQDRPVFRTAWRKGRRCLIPANGYYEWQKGGERKQPYHIQMPDLPVTDPKVGRFFFSRPGQITARHLYLTYRAVVLSHYVRGGSPPGGFTWQRSK